VTTFFTSDLHFGHRKVAALRGFGEEPASVLAHDEEISARWRGIVSEGDVVYVLGDLSAGGRAGTEHALGLLMGLPGRKRLILGNHDPAHPMNREAWKWSERFGVVFEQVAPFARTKVLGREVVLSHFPYERDRGETRYAQWRLRDEGLPLLHGHTHGEERLTVTPRPAPAGSPGRVEVHVGVDAWGLSPVTDEVVAMLLARAYGG
jgi:calcineurin-like phosphoesterase family protein